VEAIVELLKTNDLPVSDLGAGQRIFMVALLNEKVVGCVAVEIYGDIGLLRSLAVNTEHRRNGIGMKLVAEAETWSYDKGIKCLYLLTTTAVGFFSKLGWANTERTKVPLSVLHSPEFASICPTTAICLSKSFVV
jgi:N-acetylglutamate synthase and related acetyltransferases